MKKKTVIIGLVISCLLVLGFYLFPINSTSEPKPKKQLEIFGVEVVIERADIIDEDEVNLYEFQIINRSEENKYVHLGQCGYSQGHSSYNFTTAFCGNLEPGQEKIFKTKMLTEIQGFISVKDSSFYYYLPKAD